MLLICLLVLCRLRRWYDGEICAQCDDFQGIPLMVSWDWRRLNCLAIVYTPSRLVFLDRIQNSSTDVYKELIVNVHWPDRVCNQEFWRKTYQEPVLSHIMHMDDNADAKRILLASPLADWRRQLGRPRITFLSTVQQDLKQHHLALREAADLAQNRPLWRMMSTYGATQS